MRPTVFLPFLTVIALGCSSDEPVRDMGSDADVDQSSTPEPDSAPDTTDAKMDIDSGGAGSVRVAQYNIFFLNADRLSPIVGLQAQAALDVVSRHSPDILIVNEFEVRVPVGDPPSLLFDDSNSEKWVELLNERIDPDYPFTVGVLGNHGFPFPGFDPAMYDAYFTTKSGRSGNIGRLGYTIASRYPILEDQARIVTDFAWEDLPGNMLGELETNEGITVPPGYPLFGKAVAIIPIDVGGSEPLTLVALHTAAPVGTVVSPYRNRDELHGLRLLIEGNLPGVDPLPTSRFVLLGDFNADPDHGDAFPDAIQNLLGHELISEFTPIGRGTYGTNPLRNTHATVCPAAGGPDPSTGLQFQLDYILPSATIGDPIDGDMFWPDPVLENDDWTVACQASDHMMLWADLPIESASNN